jgi:hypothetical protein
MTQKGDVGRILDDYRAEFEQGDYQGFFEALLLCCWSSIPLPEWVYKLVIQHAEDAFNKRATSRGRTGNWRSRLNRLHIDRYRANMVEMHLRFRRRFGRHHVSCMAALDGYGTPSDNHPGENVVTLQDILGFLAKEFQGTPYQGGSGAIAKSYKKMKGLHRRKAKVGRK